MTHLADLQRTSARGEHALWSGILAERDRRLTELDHEESPSSMHHRMAVNTIALDIAHELHRSENQIWRIISQGEAVREHTPAVWAAFADGLVDAAQISVVAHALNKVELDVTRARLDNVVVPYAVSHTPAELRVRLDRLVERLEPPALSAAERAYRDRHVRTVAAGDGMGLLQAFIPTLAAAAIDRRLTAAAKQLVDESDNPRTVEQKRADLLCSWLTNATGTETDIHAQVAVIVEATALAGVTDTPALVTTTEGQMAVPPAWVLQLAQSGNALWTRLLTDPRGRVLDVTHHGYQPPDVLRDAIRWRDHTCRVSGCHTRAENCDLDHVKPHDSGGPTTADNLQTLCRRHHGMKGHGLLTEDDYDPPHEHLTWLPDPDAARTRRLTSGRDMVCRVIVDSWTNLTPPPPSTSAPTVSTT